MLVCNFYNWFQSIGLKILIHEILLCVNCLIKVEYTSIWQVCKKRKILFFDTSNIFFPQFSSPPNFSTSLSNHGLLPSSHLDSAVRGMSFWADPSTSPPLWSDVIFVKQSSTFSWESVPELVAHDGSLTCVRKTLGSQRAEDSRSQVTGICARIGKDLKNKRKKYLLMYDRKPQNSIKQLYFT